MNDRDLHIQMECGYREGFESVFLLLLFSGYSCELLHRIHVSLVECRWDSGRNIFHFVHVDRRFQPRKQLSYETDIISALSGWFLSSLQSWRLALALHAKLSFH